jgi:hypothetical protein
MNYIINSATKNKVAIEDKQLLVTINQKLTYYECLKYIPENEVSFSKILGMIDILGIEKKATKFMTNSLIFFAKKYETDIDNTMVYLVVKNEEIQLMCYCNRVFKEKISLMEHFNNVKIE